MSRGSFLEEKVVCPYLKMMRAEKNWLSLLHFKNFDGGFQNGVRVQ